MALATLESVAGQDLLHQSLYFNQTRKFELLYSVVAECWDQRRAQALETQRKGQTLSPNLLDGARDRVKDALLYMLHFI